MDKGAQEEMNPLISDPEKSAAIRKFIVARYNQEIKITDFSHMPPYLNNGDIKLLRKLEPSGVSVIQHTYDSDEIVRNGRYTSADAEKYFDWLTSVAFGSLIQSPEVVKESIDQLAFFILILGDAIQEKKHVEILPPYDWQSLLLSFDERITDLKKSMEIRDEKITHIITQVYDWIKEYRPILDKVKKDYDKVGKVLSK